MSSTTRSNLASTMRLLTLVAIGVVTVGAYVNARAAASAPSALPEFNGAPRVYHMGATGFFLDHPEHITLTAPQRNTLEAIKERAAKTQAEYRRQIEKVESEIWTLIGAERPDAMAIEAKIREVEALRTQQRMAYIRAVGEAGNVLTNDQRKQLSGLERAASPATR